MRLFATFPLFSVALAGSVLQRRDATTVYNDISGINSAVLKLTKTLNAYSGGITQSEPVFDATIAIHAINRKGYADAMASQPFTSAESKRIVNHTNKTVGVTIPASVKVLEAKKPLFDAAQLSSLVEATILLLKNEAVGSKLSLNEAPAGLIVAGKIDAVLQEAALYYANSTL